MCMYKQLKNLVDKSIEVGIHPSMSERMNFFYLTLGMKMFNRTLLIQLVNTHFVFFLITSYPKVTTG